jgi:hypothetical protein
MNSLWISGLSLKTSTSAANALSYASCGTLTHNVGTLDGVAVKIKCPVASDIICDPRSKLLLSRKTLPPPPVSDHECAEVFLSFGCKFVSQIVLNHAPPWLKE